MSDSLSEVQNILKDEQVAKEALPESTNNDPDKKDEEDFDLEPGSYVANVKLSGLKDFAYNYQIEVVVLDNNSPEVSSGALDLYGRVPLKPGDKIARIAYEDHEEKATKTVKIVNLKDINRSLTDVDFKRIEEGKIVE